MKEIIENISKICNNEKIVSYCERLLEINKEYIMKLNDNYVFAKRYDEVLEINVNNNSFKVFFTEWGTTSRRKLEYKIDNEQTIISFDDNEITNDGIRCINYTYVFSGDKLVYMTRSKNVNLEYCLGKEIKKIKKTEKLEIYPISDNKALKKVVKNNIEKYYVTNIGLINLRSVDVFQNIYTNLDEEITKDNYSKIKDRW